MSSTGLKETGSSMPGAVARQGPMASAPTTCRRIEADLRERKQ